MEPTGSARGALAAGQTASSGFSRWNERWEGESEVCEEAANGASSSRATGPETSGAAASTTPLASVANLVTNLQQRTAAAVTGAGALSSSSSSLSTTSNTLSSIVSTGNNNNNINSSSSEKPSAAQKSFWQAITVGDLETVKCLLEHRDISINMYDTDGEQRQGGTALHLAILEMPTWKGSEGRNGIQTSDFVKEFIQTLLDYGADIEKVCRYKGEWYLQTAAGKTKTFFPEGYDSLGLALQFIEITRGAEVIANDVTKRLELIRDLLLEHINQQDLKANRALPSDFSPNFAGAMYQMYKKECFTDVELRCEGEVFKAHRVVLAARSVVFEKMLNSNLKEAHTKVIEVKEVDRDALEAFITFMYTDKIANTEKACDLLILSNRYDVKDLKDLCSFTLAKTMNVQNAASILNIADMTNSMELKECAILFISQHIKTIREVSEDFQKLSKSLLQEVFNSYVDLSHPPRKRARRDTPVVMGPPAMHGLHSPGQQPPGLVQCQYSQQQQQQQAIETRRTLQNGQDQPIHHSWN